MSQVVYLDSVANVKAAMNPANGERWPQSPWIRMEGIQDRQYALHFQIEPTSQLTPQMRTKASMDAKWSFPRTLWREQYLPNPGTLFGLPINLFDMKNVTVAVGREDLEATKAGVTALSSR